MKSANKIRLLFIILILLSCVPRAEVVKDPSAYYELHGSKCYKFTLPYENMTRIKGSLLLEDPKRYCFDFPLIFRKSEGKELINIYIFYYAQWGKTEEYILRKRLNSINNAKKSYDNASIYNSASSKIIKFEDKGRNCIKLIWEGIVPKVEDVAEYSDFPELQLEKRDEYYEQLFMINCAHPGYEIQNFPLKSIQQILKYKRLSVDLEPDPNFEQEATDFFNNLEFTLGSEDENTNY